MKVLIVDDSIVFRSAISNVLSEVPGVEVIKSVPNGKLGVESLMYNKEINLITLDLEMPIMDGLQAIQEIRKFNKDVIIIIFSSFTSQGAEKTIQALNFGANDFVTKPDGSTATGGVEAIKGELVQKIINFKSRVSKIKDSSPKEMAPSPTASTLSFERKDLILIGCSTGGPEALTKIFSTLKNPIKAPILIIQHMPPMFTSKLAEMLDKISPINVREAQDGMILKANTCYIAPGDYHMTVDNKTIRLNQTEKVSFVRPSVDVLFNSLARNINLKMAAFVLTGMGEDGAQGAKLLKQAGVDIYVQDKMSSVVWGMPGSVYNNVPGANVLNLDDIAAAISKMGQW